MKYLFIFLTLPFLLCANQSKIENSYEIDSYELEEINELKQELGAIFYTGKIHLNLESDGHLWTPVLYVHSEYCPMCKSMQPTCLKISF